MNSGALATADHQTKDARWAEQAGAAVVVPDAELDGPRLAREVAALLGSPAQWPRWRGGAGRRPSGCRGAHRGRGDGAGGI
jgi:UDP-N-acetylglucosamine:LPS N-acetylglucosamine transferase